MRKRTMVNCTQRPARESTRGGRTPSGLECVWRRKTSVASPKPNKMDMATSVTMTMLRDEIGFSSADGRRGRPNMARVYRKAGTEGTRDQGTKKTKAGPERRSLWRPV